MTHCRLWTTPLLLVAALAVTAHAADKGTGLKLEPVDIRQQRVLQDDPWLESLRLSPDQLPASVDLQATPWFPPVGDQGAKNNCTTWAAAYYAKTFLEAREHGWDLSACRWENGAPSPAFQDRICSPDFVYHLVNEGRDEGAFLRDVVHVLAHAGTASWQTMPVRHDNPAAWPATAAWREAPAQRIVDTVHYVNAADTALVQSLLAQEIPLLLQCDAGKLYEMATLDNYTNVVPGHVNVIVGYEQDRTYTEEGQQRSGAFKVVNSWGPTWALEQDHDGCWWISTRALARRGAQLIALEDRTDYTPARLATVQLTHADRAACTLAVGTGEPAHVLLEKQLSPGQLVDGWNSLVLETPLQLTPSQPCRLELVLTGDTGTYKWNGVFDDPYAAGRGDIRDDYDYAFRLTGPAGPDQAQEEAPYGYRLKPGETAWQTFVPRHDSVERIALHLTAQGAPAGLTVRIVSAPPQRPLLPPLLGGPGAAAYGDKAVVLDLTELPDAELFHLSVSNTTDLAGQLLDFAVEEADALWLSDALPIELAPQATTSTVARPDTTPGPDYTALADGDVNGDGRVNNVDALIVHTYFLGNLTCFPADADCNGMGPEGVRTSAQLLYGDVNADGQVNNVDALIIHTLFLAG